MKTFLFSIFTTSSLLLAACDTGGETPTTPDLPSKEQVVREVVREAIKSSTSLNIPGVSTDGIVDCVIDNATDDEINSLGNAALLQANTAGLVIVAPIVQRPETAACIAKL